MDIGLIGRVADIGLVAPQAGHGTQDSGVIAAGDIGDGGIDHGGGSTGVAVGAGGAAQDIVPAVVGVQDLVALGGQGGGGSDLVAAPAGGPVGGHDVGVKGGGIVVEVQAVVEGDGSHARSLDGGGDTVDIVGKLIVQARGLQMAEAHGAAGVDVVGVLVRTHVEVGAALVGEVIHVLAHQSLGEFHGLGVGHVHGPGGTVVGAADADGLHGVQDGVHVAGGVDQGDNLDALGSSIVEDVVHLILGPLAGMGVSLVAGLDTGGDSVAAVAQDGHIVQDQPQTVVAQGQLQMGVAVLGQQVDELLDIIDLEEFPAAVHMVDPQEVLGCCACPQGHQGQDHAQDQSQRNKLLQLVHIRYLLGIFYNVRGCDLYKLPKQLFHTDIQLKTLSRRIEVFNMKIIMRRESVIFYSENHRFDNAVRRCLSN